MGGWLGKKGGVREGRDGISRFANAFRKWKAAELRCYGSPRVAGAKSVTSLGHGAARADAKPAPREEHLLSS